MLIAKSRKGGQMKNELRRLTNKIGSILLSRSKTITLVLVFLVVSLVSIASAKLPEKAEEGVMLHCYSWPLKAIEENLDSIAEAGFNSIQVSPIQKIRNPKYNESQEHPPTGPWWLFYQPCGFKTIGNYKVGSETDFKSLCDKAEDKGIKIIVDVVLNHIADTGVLVDRDEELDPELRDPTLYHNYGSINNYQDRKILTQGKLGTLPDLKTQDQRIQNMHVRFLNRCIDAGADGIRFDAAKHIETGEGEDKSEWSGDYWEDVLGRLKKRNRLYLFGEVLQDKADNMSVYMSYYDVTAHNYGSAIRSAIRHRNASELKGHIHNLSGIPRNKSLAYVENHDDYEHGKSKDFGYWERKVASVFLIARAGLTPRILDRPEDDIWKDPDIKAINQFHNVKVGTEEYLRFPTDRIAIIERGIQNKPDSWNAVAIINLGYEMNLDVQTNLINEEYHNRASNPFSLKVSNGRIRGRLPGGAIFVAYQDSDNGQELVKTVFRAKYDVGWGHQLYIRGDKGPLSWSKGIQMNWTDGNVWIWETNDFPNDSDIEFKVLIDDRTWEIIDNQPLKNHKTKGGDIKEITPIFW